ncbi:hypothetical protein HNQ59_001418 [Chitinivorax tropicus]|uniref:Pilus assembly protein n=1 Tax=Chitinivorax tropicus TaxID=714531 RepID=A0A840MPM6_9PROT|nr:hypothetical protein [Chitinivorax tropicus]MBB5018133.1 hypothetical protein [Chitinivorax tropicus]
MTRIRAALIHFAMSLVIFCIVVGICIYYWYPGPFFWIDGGWQGLRIATPVDLILGPLLTLILFVPGKKGLKFDLAMIAALQLGALAWGIHAIHQQRPTLLVYSDGSLNSVRHHQLVYDQTTEADVHALLDKADKALGLPIVAIRPPQSTQELQQMLGEALGSGRSLFVYAHWYMPFQNVDAQRLQKQATPLDNPAITPPVKTKLQALITRQQRTVGDVSILPFNGLYDRAWAVFGKQDRAYLGHVLED